MEKCLGETESMTLQEVRIILIGGRWAGKSSSGNTILMKQRFECGRTRTPQSEVRHEEVGGRRLIVVDAPGWSNSLSLTEIPEGDKQRFKLNVSKCPPGPHVFILVIPIDSAFSVEQRRTVEEHMKLLGERVWRFTLVLFTCGDNLQEKTIELHIESEGDALKWLIERCSNRYHVFNNKSSNPSQVTSLLDKIEEMVCHNNGNFYKLDEHMFHFISEKQREVAERAKKRQIRAEEQYAEMLISEEMKNVTKLRMVLLGSRSVGKTSVGSTILGIKEHEDGERTTQSEARQGFVGQTEVTVVDTPGWWKGFPASDTPAAIQEEVMRSVFLCRPGPHVFLLVIDADASFNTKHLHAVRTHVELLGEKVWKHTLIVFTRGDWLANSIEEYIEGEGEALQSLVEQCGNRYHVVDNKNLDDGTQVTELLVKITGTLAGNGWEGFVPDEEMFQSIEQKRGTVEEAARLRQSQVEAKRKHLTGPKDTLKEMRIVIVGQEKFGKSATGNNLLRKGVFTSHENQRCQVEESQVAGRLITVIDTPGWKDASLKCTEETDKEIVRGFSLSPVGVHAVLLVVPLDLTFNDAQRVALEDHMNLFEASVWKHTVVVLTYGDKLVDKSVEEHIERERGALRWLIDRCENRYHVMNNMKKADMGQVTELFEKVEEMVAWNGGRLFCPEMYDVYMRMQEMFRRRELKHVLKVQLLEEYRRRELELMTGFKKTLLRLQDDIRGSATKNKPKALIKSGVHWKKDVKEEEKVEAKINKEIEKLDKDILRSTDLLRSSKDFLLPDLSEVRPAPSTSESLSHGRRSPSQFDKVIGWLSTLQIGTNYDNQLTLNFSATSGYRSVLQDFMEVDTD